MLDYRKITNFKNIFLDSYLVANRSILIFSCLILYIGIKYIVQFQEKGLHFQFSIKKKAASSKFKPIRLLHPTLSRIKYGLKIYYGWRFIIIGISGLVLGVIYGWKIKTSFFNQKEMMKFLLMISQAVLTQLGFLTTLHTANIEGKSKTLSLIHTLPKGNIQSFNNKFTTIIIYFLVLLVCFSLPILFITNIHYLQPFLLAVIPPFLFLVAIGYLTIQLTHRVVPGYLMSGGLWFLFLSLERRVPYWIQPFYVKLLNIILKKHKYH